MINPGRVAVTQPFQVWHRWPEAKRNWMRRRFGARSTGERGETAGLVGTVLPGRHRGQGPQRSCRNPGGLVLHFAGPRSLNGIALALTRNELTEDPNDFIATHLLYITERATQGSILFAAIYLLLHGVVKLVLVVVILRGKIWAYPWMIGALLAFIAYQGYQIAIAPSAGLTALTVFDAVVAYQTWHEYKRHCRRAAAVG